MMEILNKIHVVITQFGIGRFPSIVFILCCMILLILGNKRMKLAIGTSLAVFTVLSFGLYAYLVNIGTTSEYAKRYLIIPALLIYGITFIQVWEKLKEDRLKKLVCLLIFVGIILAELRGSLSMQNTKLYHGDFDTESEVTEVIEGTM